MSKKTLFYFLAESQDWKTMTFTCFCCVIQKWMYGVRLKEFEKKKASRLLATLHLQNYGNNFILKLSMPSPWPACAQFDSITLPNSCGLRTFLKEHLNYIQTERVFHRHTCAESKSNFKRFEETIKLDKQHKPFSIDAVIHYSFDLAQQVHIPSNPMQPELIYFTAPS